MHLEARVNWIEREAFIKVEDIRIPDSIALELRDQGGVLGGRVDVERGRDADGATAEAHRRAVRVALANGVLRVKVDVGL